MKVTVKHHTDRDRWVVSYLLPTGKPGVYDRKRLFFRTETAANEDAARVRKQYQQQGETGMRYDPVQWRRFKSLEELLAGKATLEAAVQHYLKSPPRSVSFAVADAVSDFLDDKEDHVTRPWHRTIFRYLSRFSRAHPTAKMDDVTADEIKRFITGQGGEETQAHTRRILHDLYTWSVRTQRASVNPVSVVRAPKIVRPTPATLTVADVKKLLDAAWTTDSKLVPYIALRIFAGMRSALVLRLQWEMVTFGKSIRIPAAVDKGQRTTNRVNWPAALWSWLKPFVQKSGRIAKTHYPAEMCALALTHGIKIPRVVFRHTFGSAMLNSCGDVSRTQLLMGHRGSPAILFEHYDGNITEKEAAALFKLRPPTTCPTPSAAVSRACSPAPR